MKCPVCKVPTFVVEYQEIELDHCAECRGLWFDSGELELVLGDGHAVTDPVTETDEAPRKCPICSKRMDKVNIGPSGRVLIDVCNEGCGLWFDDNELHELTKDLQDDGWHVAPEVREFLRGMFPER